MSGQSHQLAASAPPIGRDTEAARLAHLIQARGAYYYHVDYHQGHYYHYSTSLNW